MNLSECWKKSEIIDCDMSPGIHALLVIKDKFIIRTLIISVLLFFPVNYADAAIQTSYVETDADFNSILATYFNNTLHFVAEGRRGNNALNGTFEIDVGVDTGAPVDTDQFIWNGEIVNFKLTYNLLNNNLVEFMVEKPALSSSVSFTASSGNITDLFIRTRNTPDVTSAHISGLVLNGESISDDLDSAASGPDGVRYLQISLMGAVESFTLTGKAQFSNNGQNSNPAFQIKVPDPRVTTNVIPELPAGFIGIFGLLMGGLVLFIRQRKSNK